MLRSVRLLGLFLMCLTITVFAQNSNTLGNANNFSTNLVDGQLIPLDPPAIYSGVNPTYMAMSPNGRYLYAANLNSNTISMYSIDKDSGILSLLLPPAIKYNAPANIAINPKGTYLYAVSFNNDDISIYKIDINTGLLSLSGNKKEKKSPKYLAVDPTGQFLYTLNVDKTISGYQVDRKSGNLTHKFDKAIKPNGFSIHCDALGEYLYVTNSGGISVFRIKSKDGSLTSANPIYTAGRTYDVISDPAGKNLYATEFIMNPSNMTSISMFSIIGGNTTPLTPDSVLLSNSGYFSYGIAIDPTGKYVYATSANNYIAMYNREQSTGILTPINQSNTRVGAFPFGIVVDPSGNFVYVTNYTDGTISMYRINHNT